MDLFVGDERRAVVRSARVVVLWACGVCTKKQSSFFFV
jgi:hypothetical protein